MLGLAEEAVWSIANIPEPLLLKAYMPKGTRSQAGKIAALTIAQDERSSTVFGMPREAARRGAASEVLPLQRIAARLEQFSAR